MKAFTAHRRAGSIIGAGLGIAFTAVVAAAPPTVTVTDYADVQRFPEYAAPATVLSLNDSDVSAEISGVIEAITVKPGNTVETGTELVRLDCRQHVLGARAPAAQLQAARAQRDLADFRFDRAGTLKERGAMPLEQFEERKAAALQAAAEVRRLQARVEQARDNVERCSVTAPFPAVVVERYASVGELAAPGTRLLRLVDTESLEVSSQIQEQDLSSLRDAPRIEFHSQGQSWPLTLRRVIPVLDRRISSYEVRLRFRDTRAAPGQSGRLRWRDRQPHVPANLLVKRNGRQGVFVISREGVARFRPLPAAEAGQPARADLAANARIAVDGRYGLVDGEAVRVVAP